MRNSVTPYLKIRRKCKMFCSLLVTLFILRYCNGKIYFKEEFTDDGWKSRWISSKHDSKEWGKFILSSGDFFGDLEISRGIKTAEDARFYALSTKFEPFSNKDKTLVLQFSVKHEQDIDCGGGYIKVFDCNLDPQDLHRETPYLIMFGPDICGTEMKKIHVIFNYKGKTLLIKDNIRCKDDVYTHLYTLIIKPDNSYTIKTDNEIEKEGELETDWNFLSPRKIKNPKIKKPTDWVDDPMIPDPHDKKPDEFDQPEYIPDENSTKPVDWDDDIDGDWEPRQIKNPAYKGEWKPRLVDNPNYTGPWVHPEIDNPEYVPDPYLYKYDEICGVGFEVWQVKSGTIFDNILITDDEAEAKKHGEDTWGSIKDKEKEMKQELDKEPALERDVYNDDDVLDKSGIAFENEDYEDNNERIDEEKDGQIADNAHSTNITDKTIKVDLHDEM